MLVQILSGRADHSGQVQRPKYVIEQATRFLVCNVYE